jgi:flagellar assembly factor FliW
VGERIVMSNGVEITVAAVTARGVRLALQAPNGIVVLRGEVHDAIAAANIAAADTSVEASVAGPYTSKERVVMQLNGTRFGQIEIDNARVITLKGGIIGFPGETRFVLLKSKADSAVSWLQSLATPSLAFPVVDGGAIARTYTTSAVEELAKQASLDAKDLSVLVIVVAKKDEPRLMANLLAPIVVNAESGKGAQVVLDSKDYSASTPIARAH